MQPEDRKAFAELLRGVSEVYGTTMGSTGLEIWWNALAEFPIAAVRAALSGHVKDPVAGKFSPKPSDLIARIQAQDGRPGAEEAWSMMPRDEDTSVVWTEEMAQAFGVAGPLLADGDAIAARMAFLERYRTLVQEARDARKPVRWEPSLGHDPAGREGALLRAVELGRISAQHARGLLGHKASDQVIAQLEAKAGPLRLVSSQSKESA